MCLYKHDALLRLPFGNPAALNIVPIEAAAYQLVWLLVNQLHAVSMCPLLSLSRANTHLHNRVQLFCLQGVLFLQCFMNSILQCLSNTHSLRDYCLHNSHRRDLNNNSRTNTALMEGERRDTQTPRTKTQPAVQICSTFLIHAYKRLTD